MKVCPEPFAADSFTKDEDLQVCQHSSKPLCYTQLA
jgi:hypothetical protein